MEAIQVAESNLDPKQSIESPAKPALRALYYTVEVRAG
jgi:hypothetical protein